MTIKLKDDDRELTKDAFVRKLKSLQQYTNTGAGIVFDYLEHFGFDNNISTGEVLNMFPEVTIYVAKLIYGNGWEDFAIGEPFIDEGTQKVIIQINF